MSMTTSMFGTWIDKFFAGVVGKITEKFNGRKEEELFLHEQMLDEEYSTDLTWSSASYNNSIVAADVVSMNSSLPLKKRDTLKVASGEVAKIGIKKRLDEKDISDITVMQSKGQQPATIAAKILANVPKVIKGIKIRIEIMFQMALSQGYFLLESDKNDGTGVRVNFGYSDGNTFHALAAPWSDKTNAKPLDDIRQMVDAANANSDTITDFFLSKQYFDYMRKCADVKELVANYNNKVIVSVDLLPRPGKSATIEALGDEFDATFHIIDSSFKLEAPDGTQTSIKPWVQPNVIGTTSFKVGRLVHGTLAEDLHRVAGVTYEKSGYILVSQYSHNEPSLEEFTAAQALAMPVIDDGGSVYVLHADSTGPITVTPTSLSWTSAADTTGKKVTVHSDKAFTASKSEGADWLTLSTRGNVITAKVSANTGESAAKRTATITVTDTEGNTATVSVEQAA